PRRALPAFDRLIKRLDARLRGLRGRKIVDLLAVQAVTGRDLDGLKAVENVKLGQRQAVDAASAHRLAREHRVEPPAAARATGIGAEFATALADQPADLVVELGRKRAAPDARRVSFGDAKHVADRPRPEAG